MGNYKFKISDMIPNAWFYKLKDMSSRMRNQSRATNNKHKSTSSSSSSASSFSSAAISTANQARFSKNVAKTLSQVSSNHLHESPRKSSKKRRSSVRRSKASSSSKLVSTTVSAGCRCRATFESVWTNSDSTPDWGDFLSSPVVENSSSGHDQSNLLELDSDPTLLTRTCDTLQGSISVVCHRSDDDLVTELEKQSTMEKSSELNGIDAISELELPPIVTRPESEKLSDLLKNSNSNSNNKKKNKESIESKKAIDRPPSIEVIKEDNARVSVSKFHANSPGVKLRISSPRISSRRVRQSSGRKSVSSSSGSSLRSGRRPSETMAVVKSSQDPHRDFKESMVEMIKENNIRASKDLEELLACYLSLNSNEYHELIIEVFKQIWFEINGARMKRNPL